MLTRSPASPMASTALSQVSLRRRAPLLGCLFGTALAVSGAACGGGDEEHAHPTVAILSPAEGAEVTMGADADLSVPLTLKLDMFTPKAPGQCAGAEDCGHIHIRVDGDACNDTAMMLPYNNAGTSSMVTAKMVLCEAATRAGAHKFIVSLHDDTHAPYLDHESAPVKAEVNVTVK